MKIEDQKAKRIKHVFSNANEVLHRWANQVQSDARCANVFFEGTRVYSYGRHYLLGELVTVKKTGKTIAVVNRNRYSATTAKHQSYAEASVSHMPHVRSSDGTVKTGILEEQDLLIGNLMEYFTRRLVWEGVGPSQDDYIFQRITRFNVTCDAAGMRDHRLDVPKDFMALIRDRYFLLVDKQKAFAEYKLTPEYLEKRTKEQARKDALEERKRLELAQKIAERKALEAQWVQNWVNGTGDFCDALRRVTPQIIRIKEGNVETSGGASVPLVEAVQCLSEIKRGFNVIGQKIGGYEILKVDNGVVQIGCHEIEIDHAAKVLEALEKQA